MKSANFEHNLKTGSLVVNRVKRKAALRFLCVIPHSGACFQPILSRGFVSEQYTDFFYTKIVPCKIVRKF